MYTRCEGEKKVISLRHDFQVLKTEVETVMDIARYFDFSTDNLEIINA